MFLPCSTSYCVNIIQLPKGNTFLEICKLDIRISRMSAGYHRYNKRISREIDNISIQYLTDFSRILKNILWIYLNISQISVDSGQRLKKLKC